jgi:hypothetical protein
MMSKPPVGFAFGGVLAKYRRRDRCKLRYVCVSRRFRYANDLVFFCLFDHGRSIRVRLYALCILRSDVIDEDQITQMSIIIERINQ